MNREKAQSVGVGTIVCSRPGVSLVDFYRTSVELACESGKPVVGPGADRMPSQGGSTPPPGATDDKAKSKEGV